MLSPRERPKRCENCGLVFRARADARFCRSACRQADWRRRHEPTSFEDRLMPPTTADLENWLSFGRHTLIVAPMAANRAQPGDHDAGRKMTAVLSVCFIGHPPGSLQRSTARVIRAGVRSSIRSGFRLGGRSAHRSVTKCIGRQMRLERRFVSPSRQRRQRIHNRRWRRRRPGR
jgi:hypothetical protein